MGNCTCKHCGYFISDETGGFYLRGNVVNNRDGQMYEEEVVGMIWHCPNCDKWQGLHLFERTFSIYRLPLKARS